MLKKKNAFDNKTIEQLRNEYVTLSLGALIFDSNTVVERRKISDEIDRREGREPFDWNRVGDMQYINEYDRRNRLM